MFPRARDKKERIKQRWLNDFFCMAKENSDKMKREPTVGENIFANDTSDKGLMSKIYKELIWLHTRERSNSIKKWAKKRVPFSPQPCRHLFVEY